MPLIGLWMASRILGGLGKGRSSRAARGRPGPQARRRDAPSALSPAPARGFTIRNRPRPEAARVPAVMLDTGPKQIEKQGAQIRTFGAHDLWVGFLPAAGWSRSRALRPGRRFHADVSQDRTDLAEVALVVVHACRSSYGQA